MARVQASSGWRNEHLTGKNGIEVIQDGVRMGLWR
jgi:hypothetical protein